MQITHHTEQQIEKTNVPRFLQTMKALAPRSYEKVFNGMDEQVVIFAMSKAIDGLSKQQLQKGLDMMFEQGYCPDPIMFRKWCFGLTGFGDGANPLASSYRSKHAALANIERWMQDDKVIITNAEKQAYDRCYTMFNDLKWNYSDKQKFHAYEAFKGFYDEIVKQFVAQGIYQCDWDAKIALESKTVNGVKTKPRDYLEALSPDQKAKLKDTQDRIQNLIASGLTPAQAALSVMKNKHN